MTTFDDTVEFDSVEFTIWGKDLGVPTPFQPTLPAEQPFTEAEIAFMEEEPPGFFPENQNSNFGFIIRRIWCNRVQELIDQLTTMFSERFVPTSTQFLDEWEQDLGLPEAPSTLSVAQRRSVILSRMQTGAFTRAMRNGIIENYISAALGGTPIQFGTGGMAFESGGTAFGSEPGVVTALYAVVEDLPNWTYHVRIKNTVSPDTASLTRELARITPSPFTFDIVFVATP